MKSKKKFLLGSILVFACTMLMAMPVSAATTLSKSGTKSITLVVGQTKTLKVNTSQTVTWSSSKKSVASVNKKGVVTAKKAGTATISAKAGSQTYKCKVTVKANAWKISTSKLKDDASWADVPKSVKGKKIYTQAQQMQYTSGGNLRVQFVVLNLTDEPYTFSEMTVKIWDKKGGKALVKGAVSFDGTVTVDSDTLATITPAIKFGNGTTRRIVNLTKLSRPYCKITLN